MSRTAARRVLGGLALVLALYVLFWKVPILVTNFFNQIAGEMQYYFGWMWPGLFYGHTIGYWGAWFVIFLLVGAISRSLSWIPEFVLIATIGLITYGPATMVPYQGRYVPVGDPGARIMGEGIALLLGFVLSAVLLLHFAHAGLGFPGLVLAAGAHGAGMNFHYAHRVPWKVWGIIIALALIGVMIHNLDQMAFWFLHTMPGYRVSNAFGQSLVEAAILVGFFIWLGRKLPTWLGGRFFTEHGLSIALILIIIMAVLNTRVMMWGM